MITFFLGLSAGVGLFYYGAHLGEKRGMVKMAFFYNSIINRLDWATRKEVKDAIAKYNKRASN